ncbi:iron-containing alcohol dehydrogenase family protein [Halogeometricum sp. S1BR25-6]|uniref:Iron-containing alcohol dehydrogenase family protein n=1 Tax=Halogeometricum salsisoli TaxID=2950536 RepID=A0ABU2GK65_9EURY|nr:iron-containing alcohol dehydrogenase family protein [Halogeometricum sp. S1BR25-6]MDS0300679.1 iron-containing alcohol dehydrogenase family protein [Halogeometricum sp. S1BR25-6]
MSDGYRFEFDAPVIRSRRGAAADLAAELGEHGLERALVVCGSTVGETPAVMDPVREGLGDRLADVFAETTPEKRLGTAYDGLAAARECDADVVVGLGGGSSLDVAKMVGLLAADERPPEEVGAELVERGTVTVPSGDLMPVVAVPTTLAGAEMSNVAGVTASPESGPVDEPASGGVADPKLTPRAVVYDPELFATTPKGVLAASAMNGFDKGIETLYASNATPVTDATASRGLGLLGPGLRRLGEGDSDPDAETLDPVVEGTMLVQYGVSRPDGVTLSLIHAFGHGLTRTYDVQQGAAHAVVAPHVLRYLFEEVDGRRELLADSLGVGQAANPAAAVVDAVERIRDALSLPSRLRDVDGPEPSEFEAVAENILNDSFLANAPDGLDPTVEAVEEVLRDAY